MNPLPLLNNHYLLLTVNSKDSVVHAKVLNGAMKILLSNTNYYLIIRDSTDRATRPDGIKSWVIMVVITANVNVKSTNEHFTTSTIHK